MRSRGPGRLEPFPEPHNFCLSVARAVVGDPEAVNVNTVEGNQLVVIELTAPPEEIGRLVGRDGRTISAIRVLAEALSVRLNKRIMVDVQALGGRGGPRT